MPLQALPNQHRCNNVQAGTLEEKHVRRRKEEGLQNYETSGEKSLAGGQDRTNKAEFWQSTHETNAMQINWKSSSVCSQHSNNVVVVVVVMAFLPHQEGLPIIFPHSLQIPRKQVHCSQKLLTKWATKCFDKRQMQMRDYTR